MFHSLGNAFSRLFIVLPACLDILSVHIFDCEYGMYGQVPLLMGFGSAFETFTPSNILTAVKMAHYKVIY